MELKDYSDQELKEELKRRSELKRLEKESTPRCRTCKFFGSINYDGRPVSEHQWPLSTSCPKKPFTYKKKYTHYRVMNPSSKACEDYEKK